MGKPKDLTPYGTPLSDEWNTPQEIADLVGEVDWDPFSNAKSMVKARSRGGLDTGVDGFDINNWPVDYQDGWPDTMKEPALVAFVNWPFSQGLRAAKVLMEWLYNGSQRSATVVHKADLTTEWYRRLAAGDGYRMLVPPKRINYISDRGDSSNFCSVVSCLGADMTFQRNAEAAGWRTFR